MFAGELEGGRNIPWMLWAALGGESHRTLDGVTFGSPVYGPLVCSLQFEMEFYIVSRRVRQFFNPNFEDRNGERVLCTVEIAAELLLASVQQQPPNPRGTDWLT